MVLLFLILYFTIVSSENSCFQKNDKIFLAFLREENPLEIGRKAFNLTFWEEIIESGEIFSNFHNLFPKPQGEELKYTFFQENINKIFEEDFVVFQRNDPLNFRRNHNMKIFSEDNNLKNIEELYSICDVKNKNIKYMMLKWDYIENGLNYSNSGIVNCNSVLYCNEGELMDNFDKNDLEKYNYFGISECEFFQRLIYFNLKYKVHFDDNIFTNYLLPREKEICKCNNVSNLIENYKYFGAINPIEVLCHLNYEMFLKFLRTFISMKYGSNKNDRGKTIIRTAVKSDQILKTPITPTKPEILSSSNDLGNLSIDWYSVLSSVSKFLEPGVATKIITVFFISFCLSVVTDVTVGEIKRILVKIKDMIILFFSLCDVNNENKKNLKRNVKHEVRRRILNDIFDHVIYLFGYSLKIAINYYVCCSFQFNVYIFIYIESVGTLRGNNHILMILTSLFLSSGYVNSIFSSFGKKNLTSVAQESFQVVKVEKNVNMDNNICVKNDNITKNEQNNTKLIKT